MYSGSQHRSWHGTSVQVVQPQQRLETMIVEPDTEVARMDVGPPQPSSCALLPSPQESPTTLNREHLHDRYRQRTSPINTPSKVGCSPAPKRMKHARTFSEAVRLGEMNESSASTLHIGSRQTASMGSLEFKDFLQSDKEAATLDKLKQDFFTTHYINLPSNLNMYCSVLKITLLQRWETVCILSQQW